MFNNPEYLFGLCRTFHDRHYDKFPGFIGPVGFVQVSLACFIVLGLRLFLFLLALCFLGVLLLAR